jgi:hypothetical protein
LKNLLQQNLDRYFPVAITAQQNQLRYPCSIFFASRRASLSASGFAITRIAFMDIDLGKFAQILAKLTLVAAFDHATRRRIYVDAANSSAVRREGGWRRQVCRGK